MPVNEASSLIERQIDLNVNLGDGYGYGRDYVEREVLPYATSANVCSGAHTGDPAHIDRAIKRCKEYSNLALGALISYPDLPGFGFRKIQLSPDELRASIISQLGSVSALLKCNGYELRHVRPHGHLYAQMSNNYSIAETVARSVQEFGKWLILVAPTGAIIDEVASWTNIRLSLEARLDLRYRSDRTQLSFDPEKDEDIGFEQIVERARNLIYKGIVKTESGEECSLKFETISLPTVGKNAQEIAKLVRGMVANPLPMKSVDYEPYLTEFI